MATNKTKGRDDYREKKLRMFLPFYHKIPYIPQYFLFHYSFLRWNIECDCSKKFLPYNRLKLKNIKVYGNNSSNYNCLSIPEFFLCEAIKCLIPDLYIKAILLNKM